MAGGTYMNSGTLVGPTVTLDLFGATHPGAGGLLVKNDSATTIQVALEGSVTGGAFPLRAGEEIRLFGTVKQVKLTGLGDYRIVACEFPDDLPDLDTTQGIGGGVYTADGVTLQMVANVFSVKALGIGTPEIGLQAVTTNTIANQNVTGSKIADATLESRKVLKGINVFQGTPGYGYFFFSGIPGAGETADVAVAGGTNIQYTWRAAPALPNEVLIGGSAAASATNLAAKINTNQVDCKAYAGGDYIDVAVKDQTLIKAGASLTLNDNSANVDHYSLGGHRAESKVSVLWAQRTVSAADVTRGSLVFLFDSTTQLVATVQRQDISGKVFPFDGTVVPGADSVTVTNVALNPNSFVLNDVITVVCVAVVP